MRTKTNQSIHLRLFALAAVLLALAPGRAAADPAAIFVSNYGTDTVTAYDATGAAATGYTAPTGFSLPSGVAYNPANNTLYVSDRNNSTIRTFNATTGVETTTSTGFASATGLSTPIDLFLNAGVLYASNYSGNTVTAYNAATGATVTTGFTSPTGLNGPVGLAVSGTTLFVANYGDGSGGTLGAFNLTTGTAAAGFTTISGLDGPDGVALFGNDLFVANFTANTVGEYNATTGAVINASFITGLSSPAGLAVLGNRLLVTNNGSTTVGAYGIPDVATLNNTPTSSNASFITGLNGPAFLAAVPEPSTWAFVAAGAGLLGLTLRRSRRARLG